MFKLVLHFVLQTSTVPVQMCLAVTYFISFRVFVPLRSLWTSVVSCFLSNARLRAALCAKGLAVIWFSWGWSPWMRLSFLKWYQWAVNPAQSIFHYRNTAMCCCRLDARRVSVVWCLSCFFINCETYLCIQSSSAICYASSWATTSDHNTISVNCITFR